MGDPVGLVGRLPPLRVSVCEPIISGVAGEAIVGREHELEAIFSFLDPGRAGGRGLVLEGEAGIGKTALWSAGKEAGAARGYRVLACAAAELETQLAFTTLRDLLGDAFDEVAGELPAPQRRALAAVLLREEPTARAAEPPTVAVAFLTALRLLASRGSTLLAVDDVQWVDAASADALRYVLRRLDAARVDVLLARRTGEAPARLPADLPVLEVGPVSVGALGRILHDRLGLAYPRRMLQRVHAVAGGNAFYALEIARAIGSPAGPPRAAEPLPVPNSLLQLVRGRLASLPPATVEALAVAAALSRPTLRSIGAALSSDPVPVLEPAIAAEIVETDGTAVWFAHPLFTASVYALAAPRRAELHARLASLAGDVEERARHLVRAGTGPGSAVAGAIDAGAAAAAARGAPGAAAELAEVAARLTPPQFPRDSVRRRLGAAEWYLLAGDVAAARSLLEPLVDDAPPGPERARVLVRLAETKEPGAAVRVLEWALEDAAGDVDLQAEVQLALASLTMNTDGASASLAAAIRATELAELAGHSDRIAAAKGMRLLCETLAGRAVDPNVVAPLIDRYDAHAGVYPPALAAGLWLMYRDRLDESRGVLEKLVRHAAARGDEVTAASVSFHLAEVECRAGRYEIAAERAEEACAAQIAGLDHPLSAALYAAALVDSYRGRVGEARAGAERGLELARSSGDTIFDIQNEGVLGFLDLSVGDARAAADRLAPLWPRLVELGYGEPSVFPVLPNAIHALLEVGRRAEAEPLLEQLEERGRAVDSPWALSQAARLRALLAADAGEYR